MSTFFAAALAQHRSDASGARIAATAITSVVANRVFISEREAQRQLDLT